MIGFEISGWGAYLPKFQVPSTALDQKLGRPEGWVESQYNISSRGVAADDETSSMMAAEASRIALEMAGWNTGEFDAIIGGCGVMEQPIPSTAILVQQKLGLGQSGITAFDVNQTCLSFLMALDIAAMGIAAKRWRRVLIFASDIASAGLDPQNSKTLAIFGDGAAAIAIEAVSDNSSGMLASQFESYGDGYQLASLAAGGTRLRVEQGYDALVQGSYFKMDAFGIFKASAKRLPKLIDAVVGDAGLSRDQLNTIICHQASAPGVAHVRRLFDPSPDRVVDIFGTTGNQIAASLPTVLAHALDNGQAKKGDHVMLLGTAAGISAGAMILKI